MAELAYMLSFSYYVYMWNIYIYEKKLKFYVEKYNQLWQEKVVYYFKEDDQLLHWIHSNLSSMDDVRVIGFILPFIILLCIVLKSIYICKAHKFPKGGKSPTAVVDARSSHLAFKNNNNKVIICPGT